MNDNEKAAIAAGLWEPGRISKLSGAVLLCPDMHLPENLWRAMDKVGDSMQLSRDWSNAGWRVELYLDYGHGNLVIERKDAAETVFAALVALYDAEHPNGK